MSKAIVVGAGVFGAWTALYLIRSGRRVTLLDAYGAGNSRSSSGGESRIIRMDYGADEIYTRWSMRSLDLWTSLFELIGRPELFHKTGALFTPRPDDPRASVTQTVLEKCGVAFDRLTPADLARAFPQLRFREERMGLYEPDSGVLLARRAVQARGGPSGSRRRRISGGERSPATRVPTPSSTLVARGCLRFSPRLSAGASERHVRRCFSSGLRPAIAALRRRACRRGPTSPMSTAPIAFQNLRTVVSSWVRPARAGVRS